MKTIGIIGGTSWPSTISPYCIVNTEVARRLGGFHSARIILYSIDYAPIKSLYHDGWDKIPALLRHEIEFAANLRPDCLLMANNTLHKAFDLIEASLNLPMPFFHAVRLTRQALLGQQANGQKNTALFLGTAFTMEDSFFQQPLTDAGIELMVPDPAERAGIQAHQNRLAAGEKPDQPMRAFFSGLLNKYQRLGCATVILACTELPLVIDSQLTDLAIVDPLKLQCQAAVDFALQN
jgi:aspartate racemase